MTQAEFESYCRERNTTGESYSANGIDCRLIPERDGWVSVFEFEYPYSYTPVIQAADMKHARDFCGMRAPIRVPVQEIAPRNAEY